MKLNVVIPIINQPEISNDCLKRLKSLQKNNNRYIIVDNGSKPNVRSWLNGLTDNDLVIRNERNKGLPHSLNQALSVANGDYIFCTHNDMVMYEQDWDEKVMYCIEQNGNVGVAGFFGALGIGTPDIYKTPYVMQQLVRTHPIAGHLCKLSPAIHGQSQFIGAYEKCAVLDGFALIIKNDLQFDTRFGPHHCYDNSICLDSIRMGYENIVINMDVDHLGGRTDVGEDWSTVFNKTKQEVHTEAHIPFYEKYRGFLPYHI